MITPIYCTCGAPLAPAGPNGKWKCVGDCSFPDDSIFDALNKMKIQFHPIHTLANVIVEVSREETHYEDQLYNVDIKSRRDENPEGVRQYIDPPSVKKINVGDPEGDVSYGSQFWTSVCRNFRFIRPNYKRSHCFSASDVRDLIDYLRNDKEMDENQILGSSFWKINQILLKDVLEIVTNSLIIK